MACYIYRHGNPAPALLLRTRRTTSFHESRRVRLTAAGEVLRVRAARLLEQLDQAARETVRIGQGEAGSLVVGVVSTAVCSVLPEILRGVRREAPNISIDIREMEPAEQVEALRRETIDIGLLFLAIQDPAFDSLVVSRERLIVALPTGHPAASVEKVRLSDLANGHFLSGGTLRCSSRTGVIPKPFAGSRLRVP